MKKIILMSAVLISGAATAFAQASESAQPVKPAAPAQVILQKDKQDKDKDKDKVKTHEHWMGAKHQLESAKKHLEAASYDPGSQRENAIRYIDAALKEIENALSAPKSEPVKPDKK